MDHPVPAASLLVPMIGIAVTDRPPGVVAPSTGGATRDDSPVRAAGSCTPRTHSVRPSQRWPYAAPGREVGTTAGRADRDPRAGTRRPRYPRRASFVPPPSLPAPSRVPRSTCEAVSEVVERAGVCSSNTNRDSQDTWSSRLRDLLRSLRAPRPSVRPVGADERRRLVAMFSSVRGPALGRHVSTSRVHNVSAFARRPADVHSPPTCFFAGRRAASRLCTPKVPGEPMRVQPSRAKRPATEDAAG